MTSEQLKNRLNSKVESINNERKNVIMSENAITTENGFIALKSNTIDIIRQNLKRPSTNYQASIKPGRFGRIGCLCSQQPCHRD